MVSPTLPEQTLNIYETHFSRRPAGHSHQPSPLPVLVCSERLHQLIFTSLKNGAELISDVIDLEEGEADFLACVALRVKVRNDYLLPSRIIFERDLYNGFGITFNCGYLGSVGANE